MLRIGASREKRSDSSTNSQVAERIAQLLELTGFSFSKRTCVSFVGAFELAAEKLEAVEAVESWSSESASIRMAYRSLCSVSG